MPDPPEIVTTGELEQSVSETDAGLTVKGADAGHALAPAPVAPTGIEMLVDPSETVTLLPEKAADGETRRIETMFPLTVESTLALPETAVYAPEPPETVTF